MKKKLQNVILGDLFCCSTRRILVLLTIVLLSVQSSWSSGVNQDDKVLIALKNGTFASLVEQVSKQTKYTILFKSEDVKELQNLNLNKRVSVKELLTEVLLNKNLTFTFKDNSIVITKKSAPQGATKMFAEFDVRILDVRSKNPIPGATIIIKGTNTGAIADSNGASRLKNVKTGTIIEISMVGYKSKDVVVNANSSSIIISLEEDAVAIDDVVVTGYQTLSKERSAGSYTIIKGEDIQDKASFRGDIIKALEGTSTGLSMNFGDGEQTVLMRGVNSINSNQSVLYVVDGVAMSGTSINDMVNSNDIENITFLKDATAASIWGARAANGVIVVTTKKGAKNQKISVAYDGMITYRGLPNADYQQYMSSDMFIKNAKETFDPEVYSWKTATTSKLGIAGYQPIIYPHEMIMYDRLNDKITDNERDSRLNELSNQNNREQIEKYLLAKDVRTNHSLSLNGGGSNYRYYASFLYDYNQNNSRIKDNKYAINLKQDIDLTKWMRLDANINLAMGNKNSGAGLPNTSVNSVLPYMMFKDATGQNLSHSNLLIYDEIQKTMESQSGVNMDYTPLDELNLTTNTNKSINIKINAGLNITLFKGLTFDSRYQYQRLSSRSEVFEDEAAYETRLERVKFTAKPTGTQTVGKAYLPSSGGRYSNGHTMNNEWTIRNQFIYDNTIAEGHQLNVLLGTETRNTTNNYIYSRVRGYDPQTLIYKSIDEALLSTTGVTTPVYPTGSGVATQTLQRNSFNTSETELRFVSFYGNLGYTLFNKYTLNASVRVDQSNLFGSDPSVQFKPLWAIGGAWNIKSEKFLNDAAWINRLSLRASYGLGGNSPDPGLGGPYDIILATSSPLFADNGYNIVTPANDKLVWEKTTTINVGVDFDLLNNRLGGSLEYYNRNTVDLLNVAPVNPAVGWETTLSNVGSLYNKGIELTLRSVNITKPKFRWTTEFTFTYNKNMVTELFDKNGINATNMINKKYIENYPAYSLFAYQWAGLDELGDPQVYNKGEKVKLSDDLNDIASVPYLGSTQPVYYGAITNGFAVRNFNFSFMFVYNLGHKMRNDVNTVFSDRLGSNLHKDFDKRWRQAGDDTDIPAYASSSAYNTKKRNISFYTKSDLNVLSASYIKLRDITISYSLPSKICDKLATDNIKVKFQVGDLFLITANKEGIDPEYHNLRYGNRVSKFGPSFSFGLSVRFK